MNQEETEKNFTAGGNAGDSPSENPGEKAAADLSERENSAEIDNLPIESIGSYARLEELLTDEEAEKTNDPTSQS